MEFLYRDLGQQPRGAIASVSLSGQAANVWLMDTSTFSAFKAGRGGRAQGGRATRSPVNFEIPRSGRWYVVVENGGRPWRGRWGVQVLPPQPAPIRTTRSGALGSIADAIDDAHGEGFEAAYDVFISHATEDKASLVRPLADALRARNLDVWYDDFELKRWLQPPPEHRPGHREQPVRHRRLVGGVLREELDELRTERAGRSRDAWRRQLVLPLWHNVSKAEVLAASPSLADKVALRTSDYTVEEIADQVADAIRT